MCLETNGWHQGISIVLAHLQKCLLFMEGRVPFNQGPLMQFSNAILLMDGISATGTKALDIIQMPFEVLKDLHMLV